MTARVTGLSSWWAKKTHGHMAADHALATKLALAMTPVASIIRVIDDNVPPMTVEWSEVGKDDKGKRRAMSYTDFGRKRIAVNPLPIIHAAEGELDWPTAIDVACGFAMHEASHSQYTRSVFPILLKKGRDGKETPRFRPIRVAAYLLNLVEDVRIERKTSDRWPGFAAYFDSVLDYMWGQRTERDEADGEGKNPNLAKRLRTVYAACRYPDRWREELPETESDEVAWWQAWQDDYLDERVDAETTIKRGLDHLKEDEPTAMEMESMAGEEKEREKAADNLRKAIEQMMQEGIDGAPMVCINEDGEIKPLDEETADQVRKMIREHLVEEKTPKAQDGTRQPPLMIRKPEENAESRRSYTGKPSAMVEAVRASLVFRPEDPEYMVKLQKRGEMDDEELYRWGMGDYRVFSERIIESKPDVLMGLLVDMSGSMSGSKLGIAQQLAQMFVWALHDQDGVETRVWGHTGDVGTIGVVEMYRLWEKGDPMSRLGLIDTLSHCQNYDGHAIAWCVKEMRDEPQPQKVLVVLSDGQPAASGYGGSSAERHVRQVVEWAKRFNVFVLQIAIDPYGLDTEDQEAMFGPGHWLPYKSDAELPKQLAKIMARFS